MDVKSIQALFPKITPITEVPGATPGQGAAAGAAPGAASFGQVLKDSLSQVNHLQHQADTAIQELATGGKATLHDTMLALQKADLSFKLMMQVRNKIVEAYQEVLRMSV
jgi:flagellar hook-basal body complex protein FliE